MTSQTVDRIDASEVEEAIKSCLYESDELPDNGEPPEDAVIVQGVVRSFGFHPDRLEAQRQQVRKWLKLLPSEFRVDEGGGWSFLNMSVQEDGTQWGEQMDAANLMCMAIGLGFAEYGLPRDMWGALPGNVPYVTIDLNPDEG